MLPIPAAPGTRLPLPLLTGVHVWEADLDAAAASEELLSPDERSRAAQFRRDTDRRRYVAARGILRMLLGEYLGQPPAGLVFRYNEWGKPGLAEPGAALEFNLSHSEPVAFFAFSAEGPVGIDVEKVRIIPEWRQIAQGFFPEPLVRRLEAAAEGRDGDAFMRAWTEREASLKRHGGGWAGAPKGPIAESIVPIQAPANYVASLATALRTLPPVLHRWNRSPL